jgi:hypothetical protein
VTSLLSVLVFPHLPECTCRNDITATHDAVRFSLLGEDSIIVELGLYVDFLFCVGEYVQRNGKIIPYIDVVTSSFSKGFL